MFISNLFSIPSPSIILEFPRQRVTPRKGDLTIDIARNPVALVAHILIDLLALTVHHVFVITDAVGFVSPSESLGIVMEVMPVAPVVVDTRLLQVMRRQ